MPVKLLSQKLSFLRIENYYKSNCREGRKKFRLITALARGQLAVADRMVSKISGTVDKVSEPCWELKVLIYIFVFTELPWLNP